MALINCSECNKNISDKAVRCPNCGYPIKAKLEELNLDLKKKPDIEEQQLTDFLTENSIQVKNTKAKIQSYFPHIVLIGLIISIFIYSMQFNSSKENDSVEKIVISNSQPSNETLKFHINSIEDISVENKKRWIYRVLILDVESEPSDIQLKKTANDIWNMENKQNEEFTIFFYLPDMYLNGSAFCVCEFDKVGLKSFVSSSGRETRSDIVKSENQELNKKGDPNLNNVTVETDSHVSQYVTKEINGMEYTEVVTISVSKRQKIFYDIVKYQDESGDDDGARSVIALRYGIPIKATEAIAIEGVLKKWPMPSVSF